MPRTKQPVADTEKSETVLQEGTQVNNEVKQQEQKTQRVTPFKGEPLTPQQIIAKHTYQDKDGVKMFTDSKLIYKELCMSKEEAEKFLGGNDPLKYFKDGLVHTSTVKSLGTLLDENEEEVVAMRKILPSNDFLLFRQKKAIIYSILVPKKYTEFELDSNGEFTNDHINYDLRVIPFTGVNGPAVYEPAIFEQRLNVVKQRCVSAFETRRLYSNN